MAHKELENFILNENSGRITDALSKFELNRSRIVFVVDDKVRITGVITEGDVSRALLSGMTIHALIRSLKNISYKFIHLSEDHDADRVAAFRMIAKFNYLAIPIVNQNMELVDVVTVKDYFDITMGFINDFK